MADTDGPNVTTVASTVRARRDDVPEEEARELAADAVDDVTGGSVEAFTVPLATKQVRDEVNDKYGPPERGAVEDRSLGDED